MYVSTKWGLASSLFLLVALSEAAAAVDFCVADGVGLKAAFDAIPPAVLVSVIAPTALTTGWAEAIATAITAVAATRLPLLVTIAVGVVSVVFLRMWI